MVAPWLTYTVSRTKFKQFLQHWTIAWVINWNDKTPLHPSSGSFIPEDIHGSRGTIWEACHRMHRLHIANNSDRALNHYAAEWYMGIIHSHSLPQVFHDSGCSGCLASGNMKRAHELDAVRRQKFWFRKHILPDDTDDFMAKQCPGQQPLNAEAKASQFEEMTMDEIMNGKSCYFPGLVPLCSWSSFGTFGTGIA